MAFVLINIAAGSSAGRDAVWSTFTSKFDYFKNEFKSSFMIGRLMKSVISMFTSNEKIDEIEEFCKKNPIDSAKRAVEQGTKKFLNFSSWILIFCFNFNFSYFRARNGSIDGQLAGARWRRNQSILIIGWSELFDGELLFLFGNRTATYYCCYSL